MGIGIWAGRHRVLLAFAAGVCLTLVAVAVVGYVILADQRRSARVLAAALSAALAREVMVDRVVELGAERLVLEGVRLPRSGGWPAEITAGRVEASGPLAAAATGTRAPVRVSVARPQIELPAGGGGLGPEIVDAARDALAALLGQALLADVALSGGAVRGAPGSLAFDLVLRKGDGSARAELTLRAAAGGPLVVSAEARTDGPAVQVALSARGPLDPLVGWVPILESGRGPLDARLEGRLAVEGSAARVSVSLGEAAAAQGEMTWRHGVLRAEIPRARVDAAFAAEAAGLAWRPTGLVELGEAVATWRPGTRAPLALGGLVRVPALRLPAAALGTEVTAEGLEARVSVEPGVAAGLTASGDASVRRLSAAGLDLAPVKTGYRLGLAANGAVSRIELRELGLHFHGATLTGGGSYEAAGRRLDGQLTGERVDLGPLLRQLLPRHAPAHAAVGATGLRVTASDVDPVGLGRGTVEVTTSGLGLRRPDGDLGARRATVRATLEPAGLALVLDAESVTGAVPAFRGTLARFTGSVQLDGPGRDGLVLQRGALAGRAADGGEIFSAGLRPSPAGGVPRWSLVATVPDLGRLGTLWPEIERRVAGSAELTAEVAGAGLDAADGRLRARIDEGELLGGKIFLRDVTVDLPIRRGAAFPGLPPWGRLSATEILGYGVLIRDLVTPARMAADRLLLNDLDYALYSGRGEGWLEVELEPAGPFVKGRLSGERLRIEEFVGTYGIRGGTMTGLLRYDLDVQYRTGRLGVKGRLDVPEGGAVNIELLERVLGHAGADPTGVIRRALGNLRTFRYREATAAVRTAEDDIRVNLVLEGQRFLGIFPTRVDQINIPNLPVGFLARQFPGR